MSVQAIAWVLEHSKTRATTRLVMIGIANHIDGRGEGWCYRSDVLRAANCSDDSYFRATEAAKKLGELEIDERGGGNLKMRGGYRPNRFIFPKMIAMMAQMCDPQLAAHTEEGCDPQLAAHTEEGCDPQVAGGRPPQVAGHRPPQVAGHTPSLIRKEPSLNRPGTPTGEPDGLRSTAAQVVAAWWGRTKPTPTENQTAVTKAVTGLLKAGWGPDAISSALDKASVATNHGILIRLREAAGSAEPPQLSFQERVEAERRSQPPPPDETGPVTSREDVAGQAAKVRQAARRRRSKAQEESD